MLENTIHQNSVSALINDKIINNLFQCTQNNIKQNALYKHMGIASGNLILPDNLITCYKNKKQLNAQQNIDLSCQIRSYKADSLCIPKNIINIFTNSEILLIIKKYLKKLCKAGHCLIEQIIRDTIESQSNLIETLDFTNGFGVESFTAISTTFNDKLQYYISNECMLIIPTYIYYNKDSRLLEQCQCNNPMVYLSNKERDFFIKGPNYNGKKTIVAYAVMKDMLQQIIHTAKKHSNNLMHININNYMENYYIYSNIEIAAVLQKPQGIIRLLLEDKFNQHRDI
ncbi:hypothetical protein CAXC1_10005 [Candidatus Xenohaliotis californiensis]|uniref:Uncharacterized protein n=1 Tax=Candidatus Xenohaliotis californiensis TaxID=84677 RepID=A0ABM9N8E5_9RICK|nr:hypothetical protein CAXC1_10005 [Candidatus Xenohaliotis californiensis]